MSRSLIVVTAVRRPRHSWQLDLAVSSWADIAMKAVKIAELKDRLSEHLRAVERGAEVVVTDRGRPIARIVPFPSGQPSATIEGPKVPFSTIRSRRRARPARWTVESGELLIAERGDR
jgi:prevent-host-death family protein